MLLALPETTKGESGSMFPSKAAALGLWWSRPKGCWMLAWAVCRVCSQWLSFLLKLSVFRGRQRIPYLLADLFFVFHRNVAAVAQVTKAAASQCVSAQGWAESNLCLHRQIPNALSWLRVSLVLNDALKWFAHSEKTALPLAGVWLFWLEPLCRLHQRAALPFLCNVSEGSGEHRIFF